MSLEVQGMEQLLRNLKELGTKVNAKTEEKALKAGAKILEDEIKREANRIRDDGTLFENIKSTKVKNGRIIVHTGDAYHAHLVEFGRSAGQKTYKDKRGRIRLAKWGTTTPQPVVQGSFERKKPEILKEMANVIRRELDL